MRSAHQKGNRITVENFGLTPRPPPGAGARITRQPHVTETTFEGVIVGLDTTGIAVPPIGSTGPHASRIGRPGVSTVVY